MRDIAYSPIVDRPRIQWPGGARIAVVVASNVEFYEYQPPHSPWRNPYPRVPAAPDVVRYAHRDYGNRVAFWRMLETLDEFRTPVTVSLNVAVLDHFPEIGEAMARRGWSFMSHGIYNTRFLFGMSEDEERAFYQDTIATVYRHTGQRVRGMLGPNFTSTPASPRLMVEAGFTYQMGWFVDDQPFPIEVPDGRLVSVPYSREINDAFVFDGVPWYGLEGEDFVRLCRDQFDVLYQEGADSGRVMCIALHPYLMSAPHRHKYLREVLAYVASHSGVWWATAEQIADHYLAHHYDDVRRHIDQRRGTVRA